MIQDEIYIEENSVINNKNIISTYDDVIDGMNLKDDEEKALVQSIFLNIDKNIVDIVEHNEIAYVPYIGSVRHRPVKKFIFAHKQEIKELRKKYKDNNEYHYHLKEYLRPIYLQTHILDSGPYDKIIIRENRVLLDRASRYYKILFMYFRKSIQTVSKEN